MSKRHKPSPAPDDDPMGIMGHEITVLGCDSLGHGPSVQGRVVGLENGRYILDGNFNGFRAAECCFVVAETGRTHIPPPFVRIGCNRASVVLINLCTYIPLIRAALEAGVTEIAFGNDSREKPGVVHVYTRDFAVVRGIGDQLFALLRKHITHVTIWGMYDRFYIPNTKLPAWIGQLPLVSLNVSYHALDLELLPTAVPPMAKTLERFEICDASITKLPVWLGDCPRLRFVCIENTKIKDWRPLRGCLALENVELPKQGRNRYLRGIDKTKYAAHFRGAPRSVWTAGSQVMALCSCDLEVMRGHGADYRVLQIVYAMLDGERIHHFPAV